MAEPTQVLTHMLAELSTLEELNIPLKGSSRLKYTSMCVSRQYIAMGCSTGCVYVFARDSLKHVKSIYGDVDSSPVISVVVSPHEKFVAFAVSSGQVVVMEMNIEQRSKPERLSQTGDHLGARVTDMVWDTSNNSLFVADNAGRITQITIHTSKAKSIFSQPSQTIVRLDSGIVQLDWMERKLLASSLKCTFLINTEKHQFSQIGKKPRDGEFGSCFFLEPSSKYPVIYCARPGSRIWEADFDGNVLNTHQFKHLLALRPLPVISVSVNFAAALQVPHSDPQSVNFKRMFPIGEFILTWSSCGLYIFDPVSVRVVLWTDELQGISEVCILKNEVYIFFESQHIRRLLFLPVLHLCAALTTRQRCLLGASLVQFIGHFELKPSLLKHVKKELLPQLLGFLREEQYAESADKLQAMLEDVSEGSVDSLGLQDDWEDSLHPLIYAMQPSGLVVINDGITAFDSDSRRGSPICFSPLLRGQSEVVQRNVDSKGKNTVGEEADKKRFLKSKSTTSLIFTNGSFNHTLSSHRVSGGTRPEADSSDLTTGLESTRPQSESSDHSTDLEDTGPQVESSDLSRDLEPDSLTPTSAEPSVGRDMFTQMISNTSDEKEGQTTDGVCMKNQMEICIVDNKCQTSMVSEVVSGEHGSSNSGAVLDTVDISLFTATEPFSDSDGLSHEKIFEHDQRKSEKDREMPEEKIETQSSIKERQIFQLDQQELAREGERAAVEEGQTRMNDETSMNGHSLEERARLESDSLPHEVVNDCVSEAAFSRKQSLRSLSNENIILNSFDRSEKLIGLPNTRGKSYIQKELDPIFPTALDYAEDKNKLPSKKKKKRPVIEVTEIPVAGASPGPIRRSLSASLVMQKKPKEYLKAVRSLDASPERDSEYGLYMRADADPDTVSISTISSIEEETEDCVQRSSAKVFDTDIDDVFTASSVQTEADDFSPAEEISSHKTTNIITPVDSNVNRANVSTCTQKEGSEDVNSGVSNIVAKATIEDVSEKPVSVLAKSALHPSLDVSLCKPHPANSAQSFQEPLHERRPSGTGENIPPLIDRLSALGLAPASVNGEDRVNTQDLFPKKNRISHVSRQKISASVKERVSKIGSSTKSLLWRVKEKTSQASRNLSHGPPSTAAGSIFTEYASVKDNDTDIDMGNILQQDVTDSAMTPDSNACPIILDRFVAKCKEAELELKQPSVVLNAQRLREVLNTWAEELNHTLLLYHHAVQLQQAKTSDNKQETLTPDSTAEEKDNHKNNEQENSSCVQREQPAEPPPGSKPLALSLTETALTVKIFSHQNMDSMLSSHDDAEIIALEIPVPLSTDGKLDNAQDVIDRGCSHSETQSQSVSGASSSNFLSSEHGSVDISVANFSTSEGLQENFNSSSIQSSLAVNKENKIALKTENGHLANGNELDENCVDFFPDWSQVCHVTDPFQLSQPVHMLATTLACHCLECGCFGKSTSIFTRKSGPRVISAALSTLQVEHSSFDSFTEAQPAAFSTGTGSSPEENTSSLPRSLYIDQDSQSALCKPASFIDKSVKSLLRHNLENSSENGNFVDRTVNSAHDELGDSTLTLVHSSKTVYGNLPADTQIQRLSPTGDSLSLCPAAMPSGLELVNGYNKEMDDICLDQKRALFVRLHYHLLPRWRLHRLLAEDDGKSKFATWCSVLAASEAVGYGDIVWVKTQDRDISGALDYLRSGILPNKSAFLGHISRIFALSPMDVVELVWEIPHQVRLEDLLYLCRLHRKPLQQILSRYLALKLSATQTHNKEVIKQLCATSESRLVVLECALALLTAGSDHSQGPAPLLTSPVSGGLVPEVLTAVVQQILSQVSEREVSPALQMCCQHSYWKGCLLLWKRCNKWQNVLQLIVKLNDLSFLKGQSEFGYAPRNEEEWCYLLSLFMESSTTHHSNKNMDKETEREEDDHEKDTRQASVEPGRTVQPLSWLQLGLLAAQTLGSKKTVQLLQSCCIASSDGCSNHPVLNEEFYSTCLALAAIEHEQKLVVHNMLEKVDSYLWAKKPVHVTPQLHYAAVAERQAVHSGDIDSHLTLFSHLMLMPVTKNQLAEDPDCHWGVKVTLDMLCAVCQVKVTESVSHMEPGLLMFKCGHVFHKFCIPDKECPLC